MVDGGRLGGVGSGGTDLACADVRFWGMYGSADSEVRVGEGTRGRHESGGDVGMTDVHEGVRLTGCGWKLGGGGGVEGCRAVTTPFESAFVGRVCRVAIPHARRAGVLMVVCIDAGSFAGVRSGAVCGELEVRSSGRETLAD